VTVEHAAKLQTILKANSMSVRMPASFLDQLGLRQRFADLLAIHGTNAGRVQAQLGSAPCAVCNAVARVVPTTKMANKAANVW
jgi:hypothetical protein